jgi:phosphoribosylglycinamide formyltransferase-1
MMRIAIFASGAGSNAERIITASPPAKPPLSPPKGEEIEKIEAENETAWSIYEVALVVCNKPEAGVLKIAARENIPALLIEKERFFNGDHYLPELQQYQIDFIVLAGFLWKIPAALIHIRTRTSSFKPPLLPRGSQVDPSHLAMRSANTPPATWK